MAWNNPDELRVGLNGQIYTGAIGTTAPTHPSNALNAAFVGLGYTNEDGPTVNVNPDFQDFNAWQEYTPVRIEKTAQNAQVSYGLLQWDEDTVPLAFGGGSVQTVSGGYRYNLPDPSTGPDERALVVEILDGSEHDRWVFPRTIAVEAVETNYRRSAEAQLPITQRVLTPAGGGSPGYYLTDSAAFAAGS